MNFGYSEFQRGLAIHNIMFTVVFVIIVGFFIVTIVKGLSTWGKNNRSPRLTVEAEIVSKRTHISHHSNAVDDDFRHSSSTRYYVTFQVESGDRMEFQLSGAQYGLLVEGDKGNLTFQGTRYLSFDRT